MIELKNITKKYGNQTVLDNVNLTFTKGNIYCIKGISGSGKSTLLNIISGLDKQYEGEYIVNDKNLNNLSKKEKELYTSSIGYMMQKSLLYKGLSIIDNLLMIENNKEKIEELADILNVNNILHKNPKQISGGEAQRIALLRSLLNDNQIIILDEPTSNLDKKNSITFASFLKKIDISNKIIIIATHKDIFDEVANIKIDISFGNVKVENKNIKKDKNKTDKDKQEKSSKKRLFISALKLHRKQNIIIQLFIVIFLCAIFIVSSFFINYKKSYLNNLLLEYPYNVVDIEDNNGLNNIKHNYKINEIYDDYKYEKDGTNYYFYLPINYSTIKDKDLLYGKYPTSKDEILINEGYAITNYNNIKIEDVINKEININNKKYTITGIIPNELNSNDFKKFIHYYASNSYQSDIICLPNIFMDYEELKSIGEVKTERKIIAINSDEIIKLYSKNDFNQSKFSSSYAYATNANVISEELTSMKSKTIMYSIISAFAIVLTILFLTNEIKLELFYRQKELGSLQLFHYTKDDVSIFILMNYIITFIIDIILSILLYIAFMLYYKYKTNLFLLLNIEYILLILFTSILVFTITIDIPLQKYLKKDIKTLLNS